MVTLTPFVYKQGAKWVMNAKNKVQTATAHFINGAILDPDEIATEVVDTSVIGAASSNYSESSNSIKFITWFESSKVAKAKTGIELCQGSLTKTLATPVTGNPTAYITVNGYRIVKDRSTGSFTDYPEENISLSDLATWITNNGVRTDNSLVLDYSQGNITIAPWARNIVPADDNVPPENIPTAADVFTNWTADDAWTYAAFDKWILRRNEDNPIPSFVMYSPNVPFSPADQDIMRFYNAKLQAYAISKSWGVSVQRTSNYTLNINWTAPKRVLYMAASRSVNILAYHHELDNYAFMDVITEVTIHIVAQTYNKEWLQYVTANGTGSLRDPYDMPKTELLHSDTKRTGSIFRAFPYELANKLPQYLSKGKYYFRCTVYAIWALQNNISIGTTAQIMLQNGKYITRISGATETVCTFRIVRITKNYKQGSFVYDLEFMEV